MRTALTSAFAAAGLVAALSTPGTASAAGGLDWRDCGDGLLCATTTVPADWADPRGSGVIELALAKLPARDQSRKAGTLLSNLGGPAAMLEYLPHYREAYTALTEWFDVVLFDPRGFGRSSGVACPEAAPFTLEWAMPSRAVYDGFATANRAFAVKCATAIGPLLGHTDSWQVAHDMDAIRKALGERAVNYYGNSYGTVFGQAYAELFPRNVNRMYLDSVLDHTDRDFHRWTEARAVVAERNLHRFARWCAEDSGCALHEQGVLAVWDRVMAEAAREPIPAPGKGTTATAGLIASQARVSAAADWPATARALAAADAGDASAFVPPLPPPPGALAPDMSRVMMCADFPYAYGYDEVTAVQERLTAVAPRLGRIHAWWMATVHCAGLPRVSPFPPHPIRARGLPPVLVASGSNDSTTPPGHARRVVEQLPGARYLPVEGEHALYLSGNTCVREHVHRYLLTGALPSAGTAC